jgi:hypothetical protein
VSRVGLFPSAQKKRGKHSQSLWGRERKKHGGGVVRTCKSSRVSRFHSLMALPAVSSRVPLLLTAIFFRFLISDWNFLGGEERWARHQ